MMKKAYINNTTNIVVNIMLFPNPCYNELVDHYTVDITGKTGITIGDIYDPQTQTFSKVQ